MSGVVVTCHLKRYPVKIRLAVDTSADFDNPTYHTATVTNGIARFDVTGLSADTAYYCAPEINTIIRTDLVGQFRTAPASPASFTAAFAGDNQMNSQHAVWDAIRAKSPLFFFHLGDFGYADNALASQTPYRLAYQCNLASPEIAQLFREIPTYYMWDDHDYGPNDGDGSSTGRDAACQTYRERVPHPTLAVDAVNTDPIYFSFEIGRVVFIVTDQRSMADPKGDADDAAKTMLGATQKTWFKDILSDVANEGKLFVWICSRVFGGVATAGADHWGGFTTERTELADYIQANCSGRVIVISADMHSLAIDDGTNHDFVTAGSEPIPVFQCSPLDQDQFPGTEDYGGATYSEGKVSTNGNFGVMQITDPGGSTIQVEWKGYDSAGLETLSYSFTRSLGA